MITVKKSVLCAVVVAVTLSLAVLYAGIGMAADDGSKLCPWRVSRIDVSKWANGRLKASIVVHGYFPIPPGPGVSERPTWFINGVNCGHSTAFFNARRIHNGSPYLKKNAHNTVTVKFFKPPYAGASHSHTFFFEPDKIAPGRYKFF